MQSSQDLVAESTRPVLQWLRVSRQVERRDETRNPTQPATMMKYCVLLALRKNASLSVELVSELDFLRNVAHRALIYVTCQETGLCRSSSNFLRVAVPDVRSQGLNFVVQNVFRSLQLLSRKPSFSLPRQVASTQLRNGKLEPSAT